MKQRERGRALGINGSGDVTSDQRYRAIESFAISAPRR